MTSDTLLVTPLLCAAQFNHPEMASLLLQHGANPNVTDESLWTPLMHAAWLDSRKMVTLLLQNGASNSYENKSKKQAHELTNGTLVNFIYNYNK